MGERLSTSVDGLAPDDLVFVVHSRRDHATIPHATGSLSETSYLRYRRFRLSEACHSQAAPILISIVTLGRLGCMNCTCSAPNCT
ncbi:MAG: hypothetical protein N838_07025 [Thiohalocapsa sp. PB-PSB1]|jgi:hypothetical protein|nr:MAG: hypothetical protein N838_07025 [Thiohalocapsa sp. PB-PSB1]